MKHGREGERGNLRGVLFDYGDTLVRFVRPEAALAEASARVVALLGASRPRVPTAAALRSAVFDLVERQVQEHERSGALSEIDVTRLSHRAYLDAGLDLDPTTLDEVIGIEQEAWWHGATVESAAIPVLDALRSRGIRVGLCSNAPYRALSLHAQLTHLALDTHLDAATFSADVGWRKPSPRIFAAALRALGTAAAETVMVGDSERRDIAGARRAGMRSVLVSRDGAGEASAADAVIADLRMLPDALHAMPLYWP